jgi:hypothetical protein
MAEDVLSVKSVQAFYPDDSSQLMVEIQKLVPWKITRAQVVRTPKANRFIPGLNATHRAMVLLNNDPDNTIIIQSESIRQANTLRERFRTPVKVGIYVQGHAPESK